MMAVFTDNARLVAMLIECRNFHLLRIGNNVVVSKNLALFVEDEARTLPLLRHRTVEEIESHR